MMLRVHWLVMYAAVLASWSALYAMAIPLDLRASSRVLGAEFWAALCLVTPDLAGYGRVVFMWLLMTTAMMLPTAVPAFRTYDDLGRTGAMTRPLHLTGGYLAVWAVFSVAAAGLQMALFHLDLVSALGDSRSIWLSAFLLLAAGVYQFTSLKDSCLTACQSPLTFFMTHWEDGPLRQGLRLGLICLGCCWALMLLAFVGGVMSLAFMGIATLIMTLEKLPDLGRFLSKPLGFALIGAGIGMAATTL